MSNADFQNGFALGLASGGVVEGRLLDYTVTFTVDGEPYEIVSVKKGNLVNSPLVEPTSEGSVFAGWQENGVTETFPYTPEGNVDFDAVFVASQVDRLYEHYNVNRVDYPFVLIYLNKRNDNIRIYFFQTATATALNQYNNDKVLFSDLCDVDEATFPDYENYSEIVALAINTIPVSLTESSGKLATDVQSSDYVVWTNADVYQGSGYNTVYHII